MDQGSDLRGLGFKGLALRAQVFQWPKLVKVLGSKGFKV